MIAALKKINRLARRILSVATGIGEIDAMLADPDRGRTYYPEEERKSRLRIFADNIAWLLRHGEVNRYYFLYGFDRKRGADPNAFIPYTMFKELRNRYNTRKWVGRYFTDYSCILKDKFVFYNFLATLGFPTPRILALGTGEEVIWLESGKRLPVQAITSFDGIDGFCKTLLGECAEGTFPISIGGERIETNGTGMTFEEFHRAAGDGFIIQERVTQHPRMAELYPHSINTIRLVTVNNGRRIYPFAAGQRMGAHGNTRDNWAIGGLMGRIDFETGRLAKFCYLKPGFGGRADHHPDTGVVFEGFEIPFFREAMESACRLHGFLYGIHSIGWDIAITERGPIFIEGNDNWELTILQADEGLKEQFLASLPESETGV